MQLDALGDQSFKEFLRLKDANMFFCSAPPTAAIKFLSRASMKWMLMEMEYANKEDLIVYMNLPWSK